MYDQTVIRNLQRRLSGVRAELLSGYPFFGSLVMHLKLGIGNCKTACTDMRSVIFDPEFAARLTDEELKFIMNHEVMHCALGHCIRGRNLDHEYFNIACDLVVNSHLMQTMGVSEFYVDGEAVMHLAPNGQEGCLYSAEEIYDMLLRGALDGNGKADSGKAGSDGKADSGKAGSGKADSEGKADRDGKAGSSEDGRNGESGKWHLLDTHDLWDRISEQSKAVLQNEWGKYMEEAGKSCTESAIPQSIRPLLKKNARSKLNWRAVLNNFIQIYYEAETCTFSPPDRRFADSEFIMPSYDCGEKKVVENIWFCVDTSGSVSQKLLTAVFSEVYHACEQLDGLSGKISFFDYEVNETRDFENVQQLDIGSVKGGGGTSFKNIFKYMKETMSGRLPRAVIILTDGLASFPEKKETCGVPVLWVIADSKVQPPWGKTIYMESEGITDHVG